MTGRPGETFAELQVALRGRLGPGDAARLDAAHAYAVRVHAGQRRRSGDPYITHCLAVATILAGWGQLPDVVIAGLLHDIPDAAPVLDDARRIAGEDVVALVAALRSADRASRSDVTTKSSFERQVLAVELADRLHNARTWRFVPPRVARARATESAAAISSNGAVISRSSPRSGSASPSPPACCTRPW